MTNPTSINVKDASGATQTVSTLDATINPRGWTQPALVATNAASATDVLAAGVATNRLIIVNESGSDSVRIRWDGSDASSTRGLSLAPGKGLSFGSGEVPTGKISAYSTNAVNLNVSYS